MLNLTRFTILFQYSARNLSSCQWSGVSQRKVWWETISRVTSAWHAPSMVCGICLSMEYGDVSYSRWPAHAQWGQKYFRNSWTLFLCDCFNVNVGFFYANLSCLSIWQKSNVMKKIKHVKNHASVMSFVFTCMCQGLGMGLDFTVSSSLNLTASTVKDMSITGPSLRS